MYLSLLKLFFIFFQKKQTFEVLFWRFLECVKQRGVDNTQLACELFQKNNVLAVCNNMVRLS
jgi:hypothetical protein